MWTPNGKKQGETDEYKNWIAKRVQQKGLTDQQGQVEKENKDAEKEKFNPPGYAEIPDQSKDGTKGYDETLTKKKEVFQKRFLKKSRKAIELSKHATEWDYLQSIQQYREKDDIKKAHVKEIVDGDLQLPKVYPFMSMEDYQLA